MARKKISSTLKDTMLVVTASEKEALFFSQLRKDCRYANLNVLWAQEADSVEALIKFAAKQRNIGKFKDIWAVFGCEDMNMTPQLLKQMGEFAESKKVKLAWAYPDISIWFLLHYGCPHGLVRDGKVIASKLAEKFTGYETSSEYFLTEGLDFHLRLFANKGKAIDNASAYNRTVLPALGFNAVTFSDLYLDITQKCGTADITHNQRQLGIHR